MQDAIDRAMVKIIGDRLDEFAQGDSVGVWREGFSGLIKCHYGCRDYIGVNEHALVRQILPSLWLAQCLDCKMLRSVSETELGQARAALTLATNLSRG